MNKVILMGRLTRDPDIRSSQGDNSTTVARFTRHNSLSMLQIYNDEIASESDPEQLAKAFQYDL